MFDMPLMLSGWLRALTTLRPSPGPHPNLRRFPETTVTAGPELHDHNVLESHQLDEASPATLTANLGSLRGLFYSRV